MHKKYFIESLESLDSHRKIFPKYTYSNMYVLLTRYLQLKTTLAAAGSQGYIEHLWFRRLVKI